MLLPETLKLHNRADFQFHYLYFLPWKDQMVRSLEESGGQVTCFPAKNNLQLLLQARKIARYVHDNNIKLIHAHLPWAGIVARVAGKLCDVPVIYTEHNKQERYHFLTRLLNVGTMNWQHRVIPVSRDVEDSLRKFKPQPRPVVQTILNGVNTQSFSPDMAPNTDIRSRFGIPQDAPLVGTIAVFRFQKRLAEWIEIAARIRRQVPACHFVIVGDGPLKNQLFEARKNHGMETHLHFAGLETEVRPYLSEFELYMMSSVFEGLPIALLEAMSMRLPVVATSAGGIPEVVRDGVEGFLVHVDHWELLAEKVVLLLHDSERRNAFGAAARSRVIEAFSMQRMVAELENTYNEVLGLNGTLRNGQILNGSVS